MKKETEIHIQIVEYLSYLSIANNFFFFSIPNESFMMGLQASKGIKSRIAYGILSVLKKMGLVPGMPDLCILKNGLDSGKNCFFIEVKDEKGKLSKSQKIIFPILKRFADIFIVRSVKDTEKTLIELKILKGA